MDSLELSMSQRFELEQQLRAIDTCSDIDELKSLTKQLCSALASQKAATNWVIKQSLGKPPSVEAYESRIKQQSQE